MRELLLRHKLLFQTISFVLLLIPSGVAGIIYIYEKIQGVEVTMVTVSILWFILPPPIIGVVLLIIIAIQGRRPIEIFDMKVGDVSFGTADTEGYPELNTKRIARLNLAFNSLPGKTVKHIDLQILGNLMRAGKSPGYVSPGVTTWGYFYFEIPDKIKTGSHTISVIANLEDGKKRKSKTYSIEVP